MRDSQYFIYTSTNLQQLHVHDVQANKSQRNTVNTRLQFRKKTPNWQTNLCKITYQTPKAAINEFEAILKNFKDSQIWLFENRKDDFETTN